MRYASAAAFRQALEARLVALSSAGGVSLVRLRKSEPAGHVWVARSGKVIG